jgi:hypothetical protein
MFVGKANSQKCYTRLRKLVRDKHSSLLPKKEIYLTLPPVSNVIKTFFFVINKKARVFDLGKPV